jgi:serine/threonine protein phosphatase PrpC
MVSGDYGGAWKIVGASVTGSSHSKTGVPCQDAHAWRRVRDEWVVMAVADGAGSEPLSELGSRTTVDCAVAGLSTCVQRHLDGTALLNDAAAWQAALRGVLATCRDALAQAAAARDRPVRELACTVLLTVLGPASTSAIHVGDGAIVYEKEDGGIEVLSKPVTGEFINEVTFLSAGHALESAQFSHLTERALSVAVFTDGIQMQTLRFPNWDPFLPFFENLFSFLRRQTDASIAGAELEGMLNSPQLRKFSKDDITLVVASRRSRTDARIESVQQPVASH